MSRSTELSLVTTHLRTDLRTAARSSLQPSNCQGNQSLTCGTSPTLSVPAKATPSSCLATVWAEVAAAFFLKLAHSQGLTHCIPTANGPKIPN
eukprot:27097-Rhodomonas_salina.1